MQFGEPIQCDKQRPSWLTNDAMIMIGEGFEACTTQADYAPWNVVETFRLLNGHTAYRAFAAGFKPWLGSPMNGYPTRAAPDDRVPNSRLLLRDGTISGSGYWTHRDSALDIIGYHGDHIWKLNKHGHRTFTDENGIKHTQIPYDRAVPWRDIARMPDVQTDPRVIKTTSSLNYEQTGWKGYGMREGPIGGTRQTLSFSHSPTIKVSGNINDHDCVVRNAKIKVTADDGEKQISGSFIEARTMSEWDRSYKIGNNMRKLLDDLGLVREETLHERFERETGIKVTPGGSIERALEWERDK